MKFLPSHLRWTVLVLCLCLAAALPASATQTVQAHVPETVAVSSAIRPETLSAGFKHACAIQTDGAVVCWGDDSEGQATDQTGTFKQVAAGTLHTCGLKTNGEVACWGSDQIIGETPDGLFKQISAENYTCGIEELGNVVCWGLYAPNTSPQFFYKQIDSGPNRACGVVTRNSVFDGTVACWGDEDDEDEEVVLTDLSGRFTQVAVGISNSCGLKTDGKVVCWSNNDHLDQTFLSGTFISISTFDGDFCGITSSGTVDCWGPFSLSDQADTYTQVSAGSTFACGEKTDGTLECWSDNPEIEVVAESPNDILIGPPQISAGGYHACTLNNDGSLNCWGADDGDQSSPPDGAVFQQVSAGRDHTCGIKDDGTLVCWGDNEFDQAPDTLEGTFTQVSAGDRHTCGLKTDGTIECWGWNNNDDEDYQPLDGPFTNISAGGDHSCAIRAADSWIVCWGNDENYNNMPKELYDEPHIQVSAGGEHICGLSSESIIRCSGNNAYGQALASWSKGFIQVSAGGFHTCGLEINGKLRCEGLNDVGQASPPEGEFVEVSAGEYHTCAVRSDGLQICWGSNADSQVRLSLGPDSLPAGIKGKTYQQTLTVTGGADGYTFEQVDGSLPAGLTLSKDGELTGTPTASGDFTFGVLVTVGADSDPDYAVYRSYTLTIPDPIYLPLVMK